MGSNLRKADSNDKVWHADLYKGIDALAWVLKSKEERKALLDPDMTAVDWTGVVLYDDLEGKRFSSRKARGWGSALRASYGESLHVLQCMLNDDHILLDNMVNNTRRRTPRQWLIGEDLHAEKGEQPLTDEEVRHSYHFLFPVHVFGYNWLQSNADSAEALGRYIDQVLSLYHGRLATNKVILVTHSMGGLVARHYSENIDGRENILGIVHGVMPDLGSPTAYRRMKTGERGIVGAVIGPDAAHLMPVLAQSPGPLQLLPGRSYGMGWLKIQHGTETISLPKADPYSEIYLNEDDWWRLCEKALLQDDIAQEWKKYKDKISGKAQKFIEGLNGKYHPNSYVFYGNSDKHPSDEHLVWQHIADPRPVFGIAAERPVYRHSHGKTFILRSSGSAGDGTVPVRSGRVLFSGIQSLLATEVDHEGAYAVGDVGTENGLSVAMKFTLRAIIKLARQVEQCG